MRRLAQSLAQSVALSLFAAAPAATHEFWISPRSYQVTPGETIVAALRNGERFSGRSLSHQPNRTARFEVIAGDETITVEPRIGDNPALDMAAPDDGLAVVVHETVDFPLTYDEFERFERFTEHKGHPNLPARHLAEGLSLPVRERFRRYAKALVAVGAGEGADRPVGLRAELVALANPHETPQEVPVALLWEGAPAVHHQIEVFEKAQDGAVTITTQRTDAEGRARIAVTPGHEYMIDAVFMEALEPTDPEDPAWASHWANLTFGVPTATGL